MRRAPYADDCAWPPTRRRSAKLADAGQRGPIMLRLTELKLPLDHSPEALRDGRAGPARHSRRRTC